MGDDITVTDVYFELVCYNWLAIQIDCIHFVRVRRIMVLEVDDSSCEIIHGRQIRDFHRVVSVYTGGVYISYNYASTILDLDVFDIFDPGIIAGVESDECMGCG